MRAKLTNRRSVLVMRTSGGRTFIARHVIQAHECARLDAFDQNTNHASDAYDAVRIPRRFAGSIRNL